METKREANRNKESQKEVRDEGKSEELPVIGSRRGRKTEYRMCQKGKIK